jgi:hypothetical protein
MLSLIACGDQMPLLVVARPDALDGRKIGGRRYPTRCAFSLERLQWQKSHNRSVERFAWERSGTISRKPLRHSHFDTVPCGCSKQAEDEKGRLRVIEERVADYNREIESYRSAIRVLGGDPDEQPAKK